MIILVLASITGQYFLVFVLEVLQWAARGRANLRESAVKVTPTGVRNMEKFLLNIYRYYSLYYYYSYMVYIIEGDDGCYIWRSFHTGLNGNFCVASASIFHPSLMPKINCS